MSGSGFGFLIKLLLPMKSKSSLIIFLLRVAKTESIFSIVVDVTRPILILFLLAYSKTSNTPSRGKVMRDLNFSL